MTKQAIIGFYALTFLGLTSIGIWDMNQIISDYIHENRITVTSIADQLVDGHSSNYFYFLNRLFITLRYSHPLFPGPVIEPQQFLSMMKSRWRQQEIPWVMNISEPEKAVAIGIFDIFLSHYVIKNLDNGGP